MVDSDRMDYQLAATTLDVARKAGITNVLWERFRSDADFRERVVAAMQTAACAPPRSGPLPMYFGPLEWETFFKVKLTDEQWAAAERVPWEADLADQPCPFWPATTVGKTHFAFFGIEGITTEMSVDLHDGVAGGVLPMNVDGLIRLVCDKETARWPNHPRVANSCDRHGDVPSEALEMRWYCVPLSRPVATTRIREDEILPEGYQVASMIEYLAAQVFHFLLYSRLYSDFRSREGFAYAICGTHAVHQREARGPRFDLIYNQMVGQTIDDGLWVGYTTLNSGGHEWFTALARKPEQTA